MITTYRQLLERLKQYEAEGSEWLDAHITVYDSEQDEYYAAQLAYDDDSGVLDEFHPYFHFPADWVIDNAE